MGFSADKNASLKVFDIADTLLKVTRLLPLYSRKNGGMGLGLYISYNKIRKFNGQISVKSRTGKGTTFTIDFPLV